MSKRLIVNYIKVMKYKYVYGKYSARLITLCKK